MNSKTAIRLAAILFVAIAMTATMIEMRRKEQPLQESSVPSLQPTMDPLRSTLRRCQQMGEAAATDADCLATWARSRDRFLGKPTTSELPSNTGGQE
ncbi:putative entry exclusion protein TrbK-alt [Cohaesibacter haloalkalitolerans]|uniref:putative entry exclusion protein TrbK-alt n=1 Tax=Cohaesibacter haloalkalitolerans TaxID=1162980 RepID=UPI000E648E35|nr:putative entry exclusion protein TrbK-alt [Cohaesibacter haloalkalitolerans]